VSFDTDDDESVLSMLVFRFQIAIEWVAHKTNDAKSTDISFFQCFLSYHSSILPYTVYKEAHTTTFFFA
jgi:hypothetical protein